MSRTITVQKKKQEDVNGQNILEKGGCYFCNHYYQGYLVIIIHCKIRFVTILCFWFTYTTMWRWSKL